MSTNQSTKTLFLAKKSKSTTKCVLSLYIQHTLKLSTLFSQIALERIRETIQLDPSFPWTETLSVTYPETIDVDVDDDLNRELAL